jgi:hypothetical protein
LGVVEGRTVSVGAFAGCGGFIHDFCLPPRFPRAWWSVELPDIASWPGACPLGFILAGRAAPERLFVMAQQ